MTLKYKDFVPKEIEPHGFFKTGRHESVDRALASANSWLSENQVEFVSIETVVLPNMFASGEDGTKDANLRQYTGGPPTEWHQFIRCWYRDL